MKTYGTEFHYYEIGDVVAQSAYPGHLGKVVEINENHGSQICLRATKLADEA